MFPILSEDSDIIQILNKLYSMFILRLAFYFIFFITLCSVYNRNKFSHYFFATIETTNLPQNDFKKHWKIQITVKNLINQAAYFIFREGIFAKDPHERIEGGYNRITGKESVIYLANFSQTIYGRWNVAKGGTARCSSLIHFCKASHSIQSRCSISFPYPIPSHGLSSNRFKSAFAARAVIPYRCSVSPVARPVGLRKDRGRLPNRDQRKFCACRIKFNSFSAF